MFYARVWS